MRRVRATSGHRGFKLRLKLRHREPTARGARRADCLERNGHVCQRRGVWRFGRIEIGILIGVVRDDQNKRRKGGFDGADRLREFKRAEMIGNRAELCAAVLSLTSSSVRGANRNGSCSRM